jgi:6-phosphogluconolactonase
VEIIKKNALDKIVKIYSSPSELAEKFAEEMISMIKASLKTGNAFNIALSGGSTPELLFTVLGDKYADSLPWKNVHFFWVDERCVTPENKESNYGMTMKAFLSRISIPAMNIHRMRGEDNPDEEAFRYSKEISESVSTSDGFPVFDLILLGLGEDGHTASIFPGHLEYFESDKICIVAAHPVTGQKRISLTGRVINNGSRIVFLVTGEKKQAIVEKMFKNDPSSLNYPAAYIVPVHGNLSWYLDESAAEGI